MSARWATDVQGRRYKWPSGRVVQSSGVRECRVSNAWGVANNPERREESFLHPFRSDLDVATSGVSDD
jgi:hypothetical protein